VILPSTSERSKHKADGNKTQGQTSSPHSALNHRQFSCLAGFALCSPAAAEMLRVSEIQAHNRGEIKGVVKKPQTF